MGNCNSASAPRQFCQSCGIGPGCPCTAGLDAICGQPCNRGGANAGNGLLYNIPGTYDNNYAAWLAANPQPTPPALEELIPITFNISCQACSQIIQQGAITAGSVSQGQISQTMNCVTNQIQDVQAQAAKALQDAKTAADAKAAADVKAAADALAAQHAAELAAQQAAQKQKDAEAAAAAASATATTQILIMLFVVFVIVAALVAYSYMGSASPAVEYSQPVPVRR